MVLVHGLLVILDSRRFSSVEVRPGVGGDRPVTSPRDLLQIDPGFLLWLHRLEQL